MSDMGDAKRGRRLAALRAAASYLNRFDIDDFGDDAEFHGEDVVRWAADEIERLDKIVRIYRCRTGADRADDGRWDDLECGHDHSLSVLSDPPKRGRGYDRRMLIMRQSWPTATDTGVIRPDHKGDTP
jgi:hypothetical protein